MSKLKIRRLGDRVALADLSVAKPPKEGGRGSASERGYDWKWQKARRAYLAKHPICVMCEQRGVVRQATVVDHRVPHKGDQTLFWDRANWQSLCQPCHDGPKRAQER
ncbi:HNH endonuclease signature motif containing protein [Piscinibacter sp.]|uniref:HNH endonuclease signature motif containing protein n=1 Tax=Piscinibacter sp. TaxID=1903157 RepID=UPI0039E365B2